MRSETISTVSIFTGGADLCFFADSKTTITITTTEQRENAHFVGRRATPVVLGTHISSVGCGGKHWARTFRWAWRPATYFAGHGGLHWALYQNPGSTT